MKMINWKKILLNTIISLIIGCILFGSFSWVEMDFGCPNTKGLPIRCSYVIWRDPNISYNCIYDTNYFYLFLDIIIFTSIPFIILVLPTLKTTFNKGKNENNPNKNSVVEK